MSQRDPGPVPNRWLTCPRKSDALIADKFLAFKTPLDDRFNSKIQSEYLFTPDMLFQLMKRYKVKIGLWIDLTNTTRFYSRRDIEAQGAKYVKLQCRGHAETPSVEQTRSFIEIVDNHINEQPMEIIGVHCTHGFNRTGFLIASYMVEKMDCSVEAALLAFAKLRPPGIYKEDYIKELFKRYEDEEDAFPAPPLPDWCFEYDDTPSNSHYQSDRHDDEVDEQEESSGSNKRKNGDEAEVTSEGQPKKKKRRELNNRNSTFMAGISGVNLLTEQVCFPPEKDIYGRPLSISPIENASKPRLGMLQEKIQDMCGWSKGGFPGCQPVSMDLENLKFLHTKPYKVSWKADGTRYMMLINAENEVYFFDRDNSCFQVIGMRFPRRNNIQAHTCDTLLDGEMVIDKVNGASIPRYLVYDIIHYEGRDIAKEFFSPNRLKMIDSHIIQPRHEAMRQGKIDKIKEPFSVRTKMFWDLTQTNALLGPKFAQTLSHDPDGLIFQPAKEPYVAGQCPEVLKWKPADQNSVDFKLRISEESGVGILTKKIGLLYVGGLEPPFGKIKLTKTLRELDTKIIECKYENGSWVFMRERTDKSYPNSYKTAQNVCNSIRFPVTKEILLDFIHRNRFMDDTEIMPPPF